MLEARPLREPPNCCPDVIGAIGDTPIVELKKLSPKPGVRLFAKLEFYSPTGSVKDRVAKSMIERAEAEGAVAPGQRILEPTSGNTGISLALICRLKGYPFTAVMPENVTSERTELLRMHGADIVYSEGSKGSNGAVELALEHGGEGPERLHALPVRQPGEPGRALLRHGRGDHQGPRRHHRVRRGARHGWHADGQRPPPEGARPATRRSSRPSRCRARTCRDCARSTTASSRRSSTSRCWTGRSSSPTATGSSGRASCSSRRASSPACRRARSRRSRCASRTSWTRGTSCSSSPTTATSTCRPGLWTKSIDELEAVDSTVWW